MLGICGKLGKSERQPIFMEQELEKQNQTEDNRTRGHDRNKGYEN